jgi:hypothetical protein
LIFREALRSIKFLTVKTAGRHKKSLPFERLLYLFPYQTYYLFCQFFFIRKHQSVSQSCRHHLKNILTFSQVQITLVVINVRRYKHNMILRKETAAIFDGHALGKRQNIITPNILLLHRFVWPWLAQS